MPVNRIPKPTIAASDAELERQYIGGDGWQTVEALGGGCPYLDCSGDEAATLFGPRNVLIVAQEAVALEGSDLYLYAQDVDGHSRAGMEGQLSGLHASVVLAASSADGLKTAGLFLDTEVDSVATLIGEKIGFATGIGITRPSVSLASPTLAADLANALANLGLITLA